MRSLISLAAVLGLAFTTALAQDPVKVDAKHYKVEFENAQVRVLRINYGAHEKSPMHYHPNSVAVFLTDAQTKFTLPNGKTQEMKTKTGQTEWTRAGKHAPENLSGKPFELILVELKGKKMAARAGAAKQ